jgi:DNA-binding transcriptional ArsR family regulator
MKHVIMVGRPPAAFELAERREVSGGISAASNPTIASRRLIRSSVTETSMAFVEPEHFVYCQSMKAKSGAELVVSRIAAAIGEPARTRMLLSLMDGRARTSTELAMLAEVTPSTASVHLNRLREEKLVMVSAQGRHRYYSLEGRSVARVLEGLSVLGGEERPAFRTEYPRAATQGACLL